MPGRIASTTAQDVKDLFNQVGDRLRGLPSLEQAAQGLTDTLHERYADSLVLVRVFATVPFAEVPPDVQAFVRKVVQEKSAEQRLVPTTPVLTLMGTRGSQPQWNRRQDSQGHLGIPLLSADFVESIPMIAQLLRQLGMPLSWLDRSPTAISTRSLGSLSGTFYVEDARSAVDDQGRPIISAADFVNRHGVRTVFGSGGAYMLERSFTVVVLFTREQVPRLAAERFTPLASVLKRATMELVNDGRFFRAAAS